MPRKYILFCIIAGLVIASILSGRIIKKEISLNLQKPAYERIVSLSPSVTEILYLIGAGNKVVGVTRYCDYPKEALPKPKVGGYFDPNFEAIVSLKPDLVIMLDEHSKYKQNFDNLKLNTLSVDHKSINGILKSILTLGKITGTEKKAEEIVKTINTEIENIKKQTEKLNRPKVLLCIGRNVDSKVLEDVYIAGCDSFYNIMLKISGGTNVYTSGNLSFPVVTVEGIIRMNPDIIIDIIPDLTERGLDKDKVKIPWQKLSSIQAVKENNIFIFEQKFMARPGPRFIDIIKQMAKVIHPEINWKY